MAAVVGIDPAEVIRALFATPLDRDYGLGRLSTREFYDEFCRQTGVRPDFHALMEADGDIFHLNMSVIPVVTLMLRWKMSLHEHESGPDTIPARLFVSTWRTGPSAVRRHHDGPNHCARSMPTAVSAPRREPQQDVAEIKV